MRSSLLTLLIAPLATVVALTWGSDPLGAGARPPLIHRDDGFAGAPSCASCHPEQHASWSRTFHSTMTQRPSRDRVVGAFDGRSVDYEGALARPFERDGAFFIEVPRPEGGTRSAEVALCVGSHRYQQYFERVERDGGFVYLRLPILWHIGARRWLHLNSVFLEPDDDHWDAHRSSWNDNCIFCHNTGPRPELLSPEEPPLSQNRSWDSKVGDLGIACESCHGPGAQHERAMRDPVQRYAVHLGGAKAPGIVQPEKLDQERATSTCGQCHGQRLPDPPARAEQWLTRGPTFRSGDLLRDHVKLLAVDTPVPGDPSSVEFAQRFWRDGTARLTAYEYQGTVASPCYRGGEMTCGSCHTMHSGDRAGQLAPEMRGDAACTQCHSEIGRNVAAHTHHRTGSSGSACLDCHMPRMVYGVLEIHRSHRIEIPDPAHDAETGRPDACTLCHLDRSLRWAASSMREWWGERYRLPERRANGAPLELADALASLVCGDAVQRAVYAQALGRSTAALAPADKAFARAALAFTLGDGYPSVRWMAQRSLHALECELPTALAARVDAFDHLAAAEVRRAGALEILDGLPAALRGRLRPPRDGLLMDSEFRADLEAYVKLADLQSSRVIAIGE